MGMGLTKKATASVVGWGWTGKSQTNAPIYPLHTSMEIREDWAPHTIITQCYAIYKKRPPLRVQASRGQHLLDFRPCIWRENERIPDTCQAEKKSHTSLERRGGRQTRVQETMTLLENKTKTTTAVCSLQCAPGYTFKGVQQLVSDT